MGSLSIIIRWHCKIVLKTTPHIYLFNWSFLSLVLNLVRNLRHPKGQKESSKILKKIRQRYKLQLQKQILHAPSLIIRFCRTFHFPFVGVLVVSKIRPTKCVKAYSKSYMWLVNGVANHT